MLKKIHDFVRANTVQVIRTAFAATFILRGIMQLFPWISIPGITGNFVIYPPPRELLTCILGLAFLFIHWKPTIFRISLAWVCATTLWYRILFSTFTLEIDHGYLTTPYWIFSILIIIAWAYGSGLFLGLLLQKLMVLLEKKGYFNRTRLQKGKKKKKKEERESKEFARYSETGGSDFFLYLTNRWVLHKI